MKKLLFILASVVCLLSCRSVYNEGHTERHHYSREADTLVAVSIMEKNDSSRYFHSMIDSLSRELYSIRQAYHNMYVRDSINEMRHAKESESVKDTTWMTLNPDGTITYHHYREKNTYSMEQIERYRQQVRRDSLALTDSLIVTNARLQAMRDSIIIYQSLIDSVTIYKSKCDSLSEALIEQESKTVIKEDIWGKIKVALVVAAFLIVVFVVLIIYMKVFRL